MSELEQPQQSAMSAFGIGRIAAIFVLVFGATALAVRCVAVASQSPHGHSGNDDPVAAAQAGPAMSIEQLAAKAGCRPKVQTNAATVRQGYCAMFGGRIFLTTFATPKDQRGWLEQASGYGAVLVGNRWTISASPQVLGQLKGKLGGEVYDTSHH